MNAHAKLIAAIIVAAMAGTVTFFAYYVWKKEVEPEDEALAAVEAVQQAPPPKPDLGITRYQEALQNIQEGEMTAAREQLDEIFQSFKDSSRYKDARRLIGELNVHDLFPQKGTIGKFKAYTVKRGDSLQKIASENKTSVEYIVRANRMSDTVIHPGERLIVKELNFEIEINVAKKTLTLTRGGEFFKDYPILRAPLPALVKLPIKGARLAMSTARLNGKVVALFKPGFAEAAKWLHVRRKDQKRDAFLILGGPSEGDIPIDESGIVLSYPDIEELLVIAPNGTKITVNP